MTIPLSRLFSMSSIEALRVVRVQFQQTPEGSFAELADIVVRIKPDATSLDLEAAQFLHEIVARDAVTAIDITFYQSCIEALILSQRPVWAKIMTRGRQVFAQKLSRDERQCFESAGLLVVPPTPDVIAWWDRVVGKVRQTLNAENLERARKAEALTVHHEVNRLRGIGINLKPVWTAIEDNTAGYDVLSFDPGPVDPTNRLIEVKCTIQSPLRFNLSRNEWETAKRFGKSYHFHIWDMTRDPPTLFERTVTQIEPQVPRDGLRGRWTNADIPVGEGRLPQKLSIVHRLLSLVTRPLK